MFLPWRNSDSATEMFVKTAYHINSQCHYLSYTPASFTLIFIHFVYNYIINCIVMNYFFIHCFNMLYSPSAICTLRTIQ